MVNGRKVSTKTNILRNLTKSWGYAKILDYSNRGERFFRKAFICIAIFHVKELLIVKFLTEVIC